MELTDRSDVYFGENRVYREPYVHLYYQRLMSLRGLVAVESVCRWGVEPECALRDVKTNVECVVVGTLYKEMALKPSALSEYIEDVELPSFEGFLSDTDSLYLEDPTQRVALIVDKDLDVVQKLVTGLIIGVKGVQQKSKGFKMIDYCFPTLAHITPTLSLKSHPTNLPLKSDPTTLPLKSNSANPTCPLTLAKNRHNSPEYIGLVSGMNIGDPNCDLAAIQLFQDFIFGLYGEDCENEDNMNVAHNTVYVPSEVDEKTQKNSQIKIRKLIFCGDCLAAAQTSTEALEETDVFFSQLSSIMEVEVMPGELDPSSLSLPQYPLHPALFPFASRYSNFRCVSNPYYFTISECLEGPKPVPSPITEEVEKPVMCSPATVFQQSEKLCGEKEGLKTVAKEAELLQKKNTNVLISAGQCVRDICNFSANDEMEALKLSYVSRCLCPTSPDTLPIYSFKNNDPFALTEDKLPHISISTNSQKPTQILHLAENQTFPMLVSLPAFKHHPQLLLINLADATTKIISFTSS